MNKFLKVISIYQKYSIINTLLAYYNVPHPRSTSILLSQKSRIKKDKTSNVEIKAGQILIGYIDSETKKRSRYTDITIEGGGKMQCAGSLLLYEGVRVCIRKNATLKFGKHITSVPLKLGTVKNL